MITPIEFRLETELENVNLSIGYDIEKVEQTITFPELLLNRKYTIRG